MHPWGLFNVKVAFNLKRGLNSCHVIAAGVMVTGSMCTKEDHHTGIFQLIIERYDLISNTHRYLHTAHMRIAIKTLKAKSILRSPAPDGRRILGLLTALRNMAFNIFVMTIRGQLEMARNFLIRPGVAWWPSIAWWLCTACPTKAPAGTYLHLSAAHVWMEPYSQALRHWIADCVGELETDFDCRWHYDNNITM